MTKNTVRPSRWYGIFQEGGSLRAIYPENRPLRRGCGGSRQSNFPLFSGTLENACKTGREGAWKVYGGGRGAGNQRSRRGGAKSLVRLQKSAVEGICAGVLSFPPDRDWSSCLFGERSNSERQRPAESNLLLEGHRKTDCRVSPQIWMPLDNPQALSSTAITKSCAERVSSCSGMSDMTISRPGCMRFWIASITGLSALRRLIVASSGVWKPSACCG